VEASLKLVDLVHEHFPRLRVLVRARNVSHYLELRRRAMSHVERETFESALRAGRTALEILGHEPYEARELADAFRRHNVTALETLLPYLDDPSHRVSMVKAARDQLEAQFAEDRARVLRDTDGWHHEDAPHAEGG
jgi:glutathione-regulated potassium-efflux system ancillary protein KefC